MDANDRDLERHARTLHNMFKSPGMVTPKMTADLLRWIIDRAAVAASAKQLQDACDS